MERPTLEELRLLHTNICQALGDPKRILILYALYDRPRHVSALADHLGMPQPTVSRHLGVLSQRALVTAERDGPAVIYRLADPRLITVLETMRRIHGDALARQAGVLANPLFVS
jgi:ArsR family transcriptional regulator